VAEWWARPDLNWSTGVPNAEGWTKLPYGPRCGATQGALKRSRNVTS
ncbi:uncharacterized protein METZ01_LOCUS59571, partial [marine metagenome]